MPTVIYDILNGKRLPFGVLCVYGLELAAHSLQLLKGALLHAYTFNDFSNNNNATQYNRVL